MTSERCATTENEGLAKDIGAIERELATVRVVIRRASRTRLALLLAVVVFLAISIGMFYSLAKEFGSQENLNLLAAKAQSRMNESSGPALEHVRRLKEYCVPVLQEAFTEQVEKDKSKYIDTLDQERQALVKNLESELDRKIRAHFQEASVKYRAILREEFPELEDPKLLDATYSSVVEIMERLVEEYYSEPVHDQIQEMNDMWLTFEMAELPAEGEPPLEQQFMAALLHLAALKMDEKSFAVGSGEAPTLAGPLAAE